ncbi:RNA recognition motif domain-containing protein [Dehalogenimonas etheniformans]|uniref:RNA-binding protein n=1 Tax=Dehalogenimonas etheniformans TaxID=1536648 RepID=A0A2P5P500_9CHLR|nr:RNA-binding protein [Dehalogenimonas etheniformans]PPD57357.1 RNA-binding protein [Dehalogenimonas etheniformans]QNT75206.1 RNA-binding protein [Dehalogenimonas etheniformans]
MNIYVGNLALTVSEADLRHEFIPFGTVTTVTMMDDTHFGSGQPRAYSYVQMPSTDEGEFAISILNGKSLDGRIISVIQAIPMSQEETGGRRTRKRQKVQSV